ncbi:MAG: XamI family restriction endonuclease [Nitrospirota bacterium]
MGWPQGAKHWSDAQIEKDAKLAKEIFRQKRFQEPKERYLKAFEELEQANKKVIALLPQILADPVDPELIASLVQEEHLLTALRYLGAPPISTDDLRTMIDSTLAYTYIATNPDRAGMIRDVIRRILDPRRFPWIYENRAPTPIEEKAAVLASSVAASAQRTQTARRSDERDAVEGAAKAILISLRFQQVRSPRHGIQTLLGGDAPKPGYFMVSCKVGDHNGDIVAGLYDGRILALECKASNSELNSRKRINKEVAVDAASWIRKFGEQNIVPAAAIQGLFKPKYLIEAQETPVVFFWAHRLQDLQKFIRSTKRR